MKFGPVPLAQASGAVLAHSVQAGGRRLRKGRVLDAADLDALRAAGVEAVTVARLAPGDVTEDDAAARLAAALIPDAPAARVRIDAPFTGRVNVLADAAGLVRIDAASVNALNAIDPGITLATLPDLTRVAPGMMLATVKIIPYAVPGAALARAETALSGVGALAVTPVALDRADLILTRTPGFAQKLLDKGVTAVRTRLAALGMRLDRVLTVPHDAGAVAAALPRTGAPMVLILGASATSDAADVCPAGLMAAGGALHRFGMPVDPGNLLFLGALADRTVIGLPGCARAPALNGADWVLERVACGLRVTDADIAAMGVGGLLKEIPVRPQPRVIRAVPETGPRVEIVLLAAGAATRMRGADKLLEPVAGQPMIRHAAAAALGAETAAAVHVVLPPDRPARAAALKGCAARIVTAETARAGMAESLRAGLAAVSAQADAVIVALADMPDIDAAAYEALIAAFDPASGAEICRATAADGTPGHPVLFGRRFFEPLAALGGDVGARSVIQAAREFLCDVPLPGQAAVTDLDTPEAWAAYRTRSA
ncbi:MAG: molybdopterin-binding/glycosyltransferase family 2 protein [Pseudomonadota bacterium]